MSYEEEEEEKICGIFNFCQFHKLIDLFTKSYFFCYRVNFITVGVHIVDFTFCLPIFRSISGLTEENT